MGYRATNRYSFQEYYFRRDFSWRRISSLWLLAAVVSVLGYSTNVTSAGFWLAMFIGAVVVTTTCYIGLLWSRAYFECQSISTATWDAAPVSHKAKR